MSDELGNNPPPVGSEAEQPWTTPPATYTAPPLPPPGYAMAPQSAGLSDSAAGAIAYITIIPAIVFLLIEPYKNKPFVKFHCIQCLGLAVVGFVLHFFWLLPIIGFFIWLFGWIALFIVWCLCVLKASQGGSFKLPFIGKLAAEQSGYAV